MDRLHWQSAMFDDLSPRTLYRLLALRSAVFVMEQNCAYQDLDGADFTALHLWTEIEGEVAAYCRILAPEDSSAPIYIGRVIVEPRFRGQKLGYPLMEAAIDAAQQQFGPLQIDISAQAHLTRFYEKCGFVVCSDNYLEDGIPHCHMFREAP